MKFLGYELRKSSDGHAPLAESSRLDALNQNIRLDHFRDSVTGRGTSADPLLRLAPNLIRYQERELRRFYETSGFIQNIVDALAEDATREWITLKTNMDEDKPETGQEGKNISRLIMNRMDELEVRRKIRDLIRYSRIYRDGAFLYYGIFSNAAQNDDLLKEPLPDQIRRIDFLNVIEAVDGVQCHFEQIDPLKKGYREPRFIIDGREVHESRVSWLVNSWIQSECRGISVVETVLDAVLAADSALWSANRVARALLMFIFKSSDVKSMGADKLGEFLAQIESRARTHGAMAVGDDEDFQALGMSLTGIKDLFEFVWENLAALAEMPKARIVGQQQGTITGGQYDLVSYYERAQKFQENKIRPILDKIIGLIIRESDGEIFNTIRGRPDSLDWEIEFEPLWRLGPIEEAQKQKTEAETDNIRITSGVLAPSEVREKRFEDLEPFTAFEGQVPDMTTPPVEPPVEENAEPVSAAS